MISVFQHNISKGWIRSSEKKSQLATGALLLVCIFSSAQPSKAAEPYDSAPQTQVPLLKIPAVLNALEAAEPRMREELGKLPALDNALQLEAYGFHGGYLPALTELPETPRWTLDFVFKKYFEASKIIMVPSVDHRFGRLGSYGFPRRFRVLDIGSNGREHVIKEWMEEDCPDPGRYPLMLDVPAPGGRHIRIEVYRGALEGQEELLALDELFGIMGAADHECERVKVSSEYEAPPYWARRYLIDQKTSLGLPLGVCEAARVPEEDFMVQFDKEPEQGCVLEVDLGKNRQLGWVTLFPAQPEGGLNVPGFGFPADIEMEIIREGTNGERELKRTIPTKWGLKRPGNNVVRLPGSDMAGRWLRITCRKFPKRNGKPTFALGEIHVHRINESYPIQSVNLIRFPEKAAAMSGRLFDGFAAGHPIMFLLDWLTEIEQRHILTRNYDQNAALRAKLEARWKHFWRVTTYSVITAIALASVLFASISVMLRKKAVRDLKWRITRDLHDDVGSSLGSISLTAERLEHDVSDSHTKEDLSDLALLAREASVSLREVVWVIDQDDIRLPALVQKLADRAERVLSGKILTVELGDDFPDHAVSLSFKRHLIMFFKEVIHNCARHSKAEHVEISICILNHAFYIKVVDDGCGFDKEQIVDGWGLASLDRRAVELGGKMLVHAVPMVGTTIELSVPLKSLFTNLDHQYKTSN